MYVGRGVAGVVLLLRVEVEVEVGRAPFLEKVFMMSATFCAAADVAGVSKSCFLSTCLSPTIAPFLW